VQVGGPGPYSGQLHVFLDDAGLREVVLTVRGEGLAPGEQEGP
jgi:hypothetical protein